MKALLRRVLICASYSCLCFLNTWVELAQPGVAYAARWNPLQVTVPAVVSLQLLLTVLLLLAWTVLRRRAWTNSAWAGRAFLLACLLPAGVTSLALVRLLPFDSTLLIRRPWFWPAALAVVLPAIGFALWRPRRVGFAVRECLLYCVPVLLVLAVADFRATLKPAWAGGFSDAPSAPRLSPKPKNPRVVWLIFDGLSQVIAFDHRPKELVLPNFDRLRAHSFFARAASSETDSTDRAIPSLFLGEHILEFRREGPSTLLLKSASRPDEFSWTSAPNVFSDARKLGLNAALAGWYHPYGRLWNPQVTDSAWTAGWLLSGVEEPTQPMALPEAMLFRLRLQAASFPLIGHWPGFFPGAIHAEEKRIRFQYLMENARRFAADAELGLVVVHLSVPHPPALKVHGNYFDSLVDADRALGEIQQSMSPQTTLIVTADHGWRPRLWRGGPDWTDAEEAISNGIDTSGVPFLVQFPGGDGPVDFGRPIDTVITRRLIGEILQGRLHTSTELARWQNEVDDAHQAAPETR